MSGVLPLRIFTLFLGISSLRCSTLKPNIVILFTDDLGYGDLSCYGHPTSSTPNIDRLAARGMLFTQFYSTNSLCSPSRASLLTGRLPPRTGVYPGVFRPDSSGGLPLHETTIAKMLRDQGYQTAIVGKWHLGVGRKQEYLPANFGFNNYFGIPYSQNQCPCTTPCYWPDDPCNQDPCQPEYPNCPLFHNSKIIEQPVNLVNLNERYATAARSFISQFASKDQPFFLYYAFQHTHTPQFAGKQFRNSTLRGEYGDSLAEVDWSVGQVVEELNKQGIADNTFIFFSSDNGPDLDAQSEGGVTGLLKCGKGTTYEGGHRVPAIATWPGKIPAGIRTPELASTLDLLPTLAKLTGAQLPSVTLDGLDISQVLFYGGKTQRETLFYYPLQTTPSVGVYAVRYKQYKAHYYTEGSSFGGTKNADKDCRPSAVLTRHDPPLLFDLHRDPSELYNLNMEMKHKDVLKTIHQIYKRHVSTMEWSKSEVLKPSDPLAVPCCNPACKPFPSCCQCHRFPDHLQFSVNPDKEGKNTSSQWNWN